MHTQGRRTTATGVSRTVLAVTAALLVLIALPCASAGATAGAVSPLSESEYTVRPVCTAPARGYAGCLAMRLAPKTAAARARIADPQAVTPSGRTGVEKVSECSAAYEASCFEPQDLSNAYFPGEQPDAPASEPQTIALVDAYNDPNAEASLNTYSNEFSISELTSCTVGETSGCFEQVNQEGKPNNPPFPASETAREEELTRCENKHESKANRESACKEVIEADGWSVEISTDIEVAHAICQNCKILEEAERSAVALGATEISNSWGGSEPATDSQTFEHPGIVITAAAGDDGYLNWTEAEAAEEAKKKDEATNYFAGADYPASSPHVIAVGGTKLLLSGGARESETVWNEDPDPEGGNSGAGGSGCSERFTAPPWQQKVADWKAVGCGSRRAVADVSADGDPYSGVAVYDSVPDLREEGDRIVNTPLSWVPIGGTSVASPIIASMFALAGGSHNVAYPAETLYSHPSLLHDVTSGGNGQCDDIYSSGCSGSLSSPFDCGQGVLICNAASGYDGPSGVGTPNGIAGFKPSSEAIRKAEEKRVAEEKQREERRKEQEAEERAREEKKHEEENRSAGSSGGGSSSGDNNSGGKNGSSSGSEASASGSAGVTQTGGASAGKAANPATAAGQPTIRLTAFALTPTALLALNHARPKVSSVRFVFTLSAAARVRATLAKLVHTHGRNRWVPVPGALTFSAAKGRNRRRLTSPDELTSGRYRLTLAPQNGVARTLMFLVG
jgi:hypothetical protein